MVEDFTPTNPTPSKLYLNGTEVPPARVDLYCRKEGPLGVNRYAEVQFASPFNGTDFFNVLNTDGSDEQSQPDTLRIEIRDQNAETYTTAFHGIVTGVGDSRSDNRKLKHCRAEGIEHFLDRIPASFQYKRNEPKPVSVVVDAIVTQLNDGVPLPIGFEELPESVGGLFTLDGTLIPAAADALSDKKLISGKTFQANKHTLKDMIQWLSGKLDGRFWIVPTKDGGIFQYFANPVEQSASLRAHYLSDGNLRVINNTALNQVRPLNTIIVNGRAASTFVELGPFEVNTPEDSFVQVKARHDVLYQRSGNTELTTKIKKSDAESKEEVKKEARTMLKRKIDEASTGSMHTVLDREVQPFATIEARPTVNTQANQVPSITYEVHRSHYKIHPNDTDTVPHVELNCGIKTNAQSDISILSTNEEST